MPETVQPGTKIDKEVWENFREQVRDRHGVVRGNLKTELENALRAYNGQSSAPSPEVERRLQRIEAAVGVEATDGGTDTSDAAECPPAPEQPLEAPESRPHAQAATNKKIAWLAERVLEAENVTQSNLSMMHDDTVREVVRDEYGFNADTTERYVGLVVDKLGLVDHPAKDVLYVTETKREELLEKQREQARNDARQTSNRLEADE